MADQQDHQFAGGTAVLTGAGSGMGEQLARQLADRGSNLVLIERDGDRLAEVAADISSRHPRLRVDAWVVDLAKLDELPALAASILQSHPRITLLINNAGVALGGEFLDASAEEFDWVLDVNFRAPVALTRLLLPRLLEAPGSHIVCVSSVFGLVAPAGQTAYAASKFALRGFTESLRHELAGRVGVTSVHPGGVRTRIAESAQIASGASPAQVAAGKEVFAKLLTYPADRAAAKILDAIARRRGRLLIASNAVVPDLLARLFPASYQQWLDRLQHLRDRRNHRADAAPDGQ